MSEPPDIAAAFEIYTPALRRVVAKLVEPDDVDDVLSETFLSAWRNRATYEERGYPLLSWLFAIARSRVVDVRRRYARDRRVAFDVELVTIPGPEEEVEQRLRQQWMRECITRYLGGDQRQVIWLRFVADRTLAETAASMGLSEGAVKSLQHRAVAWLRQAIAPNDMPSMMAAFAAANERPRCAVEGCTERPSKRSGLCARHRTEERTEQRLSKRPFVKTQPCRAPNCTSYAKFRDGYCAKHHARALHRGGDVSDPVRNADLICRAEGCDTRAWRAELCGAHYNRELRRHHGTLTKKPCRVPACERPRHARGLCISHFEERRQSSPSGS